MANLKSSKKDIRRIARRTKRRKPFARNANIYPKKLERLIAQGKVQEAQEFLSLVFKALDKAAKQNIIHKNKAARIKSRVSKKLYALVAQSS